MVLNYFKGFIIFSTLYLFSDATQHDVTDKRKVDSVERAQHLERRKNGNILVKFINGWVKMGLKIMNH